LNRTPLLALATAVALGAALPAQYLYTQQVGLVTGPTVMTEGVVLVDVDADNDLDVVFANGFVLNTAGSAIQPTLLINKINQGLGLVDETATRLPTLAIKGTLVVAFDIEGDGDKDLVFSCNGASQQRCYVNDGSGVFTDQSTTRLAGAVLTVAGLAYGDLDQDGDYDLLFNDENTNGQLKMFRNDGTGVFTNVTSTHVVAAPKTNQQDIVLADIDNDWDLDIVNCGKSAGQQIYLNDGTGHFPTVNTSLLPAGTGLTYECEMADLDHDGDLDMTMLSVSGVTDTVLRNNLVPSGTLSFTSLTTALTGGNGDDDNEWVFVDSDNDGDLDIVNGSLQSNGDKLYVNNGAFSFARATGFAGFSPLVDSTLDVACGDLNGDGKYDFVTAQGESGSFLNRAYYGTGAADTQPPRFVRVEQPAAMSTNPLGPWHVRAVIQDSFVDDGETPVTSATMNWTVTHRAGVLTGSTPMQFLGGLMFRASLTPQPGIVMNGAVVQYTLTATDRLGNSTTTASQSFAICGGEAYGLGLGGTNTTVLLPTPSGLSPGTVFSMTMTNAGPNSPGVFGIAIGRWSSLIPEGVLLIDPNLFVGVLPMQADATGGAALDLPLPNLPLAGIPLTFQTAFSVPISMSNGVELVICP